MAVVVANAILRNRVVLVATERRSGIDNLLSA
jgi:hypothetical protein